MFDMSADLRSLFTWNTKLVFLYVTAEYSTELNRLNQVVIWDYVIENVKVGGSSDSEQVSFSSLAFRTPS